MMTPCVNKPGTPTPLLNNPIDSSKLQINRCDITFVNTFVIWIDNLLD